MELNFPVLMTIQTDLLVNHSSLHVVGNGWRLFGKYWHPTLSYNFFWPMVRSDGMDSHDKNGQSSSPAQK